MKNSVKISHHGQHRKKQQRFPQPLEDTITTEIRGFHKNQKYHTVIMNLKTLLTFLLSKRVNQMAKL